MNRRERRRQAKRGEKQKTAARELPPGAASPPVRVLTILKSAIEAHQAGHLDEAEHLYRQILEIDPGHANANHFLGVIAHHTGRGDEAAQLIAKAIETDPANPSFHFDLGNVLKALGRLDAAAARHREAIRLRPDMAEAHTDLGLVLGLQGLAEEAAACHREAIHLKPDYAQAHNNLGLALHGQGRLEEAVDSYCKALTLMPDYAEAHSNLGNALQELDKLDEAVESYSKALAIKPDYVEAHSNLELALQDQGNVDRAAKQIDLALSYQPENAGLLIRKALLLPVIPFSQEEIQTRRENIEKALQALLKQNLTLDDPIVGVGVSNFYLAYHNLNNRKIQEDIARLYIAACPSLTYEAKHCRPELREERKGKKEKNVFRIGILSSFLHDHTIGLLTLGIIQHLSRDQFEVIIFRPPRKKDHLSEIIDQAADKVVSLCGKLERDQHEIGGKKLDILFYPDIGMSHYIYCLAFARLAPIQAVTWGHPDTTGIPNIDYFLSSELLEISDSSDHYSERLIKLRNVPTYYFPPDPPKKKYAPGDYGLPHGVRLYVCPQSLFKFHPQFDGVLGDLLRRDPNGRLVLIDDKKGGNWRKLLIERFNRAFPDVVDHVIFVAQIPHEKFLGLLILADALLDIPTFSGGKSSLEALAMGAPIATWPQDFMRGRVTAAFYKQMGLSDMIATDAESYLELALRLAQDADFKCRMQTDIKANAHKLYENHETVREMERFFIAAHEAWKTGETLTNSSIGRLWRGIHYNGGTI